MKIKTLFQQLLRSPRNFPVEAVMGVVFFVIAFLYTDRHVFNDAATGILNIVSDDVLFLFIPLVVLAFWLQRVNRWLYYASLLLIVPLLAVDIKPFLWTYGFAFTYVLAATLLVVGNRRMDNRSFAAHALHVTTQTFFGVLIAGLLDIAVLVIFKSFCYIFGINDSWKAYAYINEFIWFILAPQICATLIRQNEDEVTEPAKVLQHILNFILSPAVVIYTVILYLYFIKIAVEWDLPKGGVAWMVMGFITVALTGRMLQTILSKRYYDWFYSRFTLVAVPPLIMFWVGSIYRIHLYGFTEGRFYLMLAGVLMTLFALMLIKKQTQGYQLMVIIFGASIAIFTYIPGISAKSIGERCQKQRQSQVVSEPNPDSVANVSRYVNVKRTEPLELGEYNTLLPEQDYDCAFKDDVVVIKGANEDVVVEYPINAILQQDTTLQSAPERLLTYHNDSIMLVLENIELSDSKVSYVNSYRFALFSNAK